MIFQVDWSLRIHRLYLCGGVRLLANECSIYDTKQSEGKPPVMLELWGIRSSLSLPSLLGPLLPGVVEPDRHLSMGQIELFNIGTKCEQITHPKLNC